MPATTKRTRMIHFPAVLVCTLVNMALGIVWYGPLFGKQWARLIGMTPDRKKDPKYHRRTRQGMIVSAFSHFMTAVVLSYAVRTLGASTVLDGISIAWLGWLGFSVTSMLPNTFFAGYENPWMLAAINLGYLLTCICIMGAILTVWK